METSARFLVAALYDSANERNWIVIVDVVRRMVARVLQVETRPYRISTCARSIAWTDSAFGAAINIIHFMAPEDDHDTLNSKYLQC